MMNTARIAPMNSHCSRMRSLPTGKQQRCSVTGRGRTVCIVGASSDKPQLLSTTSLATLQRTSSPKQHAVGARGQQQTFQQVLQHLQSQAGKLVMVASLSLLLTTSPVGAATDPAKVGACLLQNCQVALAQCLGDAGCLKNLVCLNTCTGRPDETECQIRCGDLYDDKATGVFNSCAVSAKKCVPQRVDKDKYPEPPECAYDKAFSLKDFQGRWYITAGLNPLFDTFDCQEHYFRVPEDQPDLLIGQIQWRINKSNGDFLERKTEQKFRQQPDNPALLLNRGNEYLHYEDDWYVIASKPNEYVFVYYRGNNDAWKGYGGAFVYTRERALPEKYVPALKEAAESAGIDWAQIKLTDNTCKPHPPPKSLIEVVEEDVEGLEKEVEKDVGSFEKAFEGNLVSFGKGFTIVEKNVLTEIEEELQAEGRVLSRELQEAERLLNKVEFDVETELIAEETALADEVQSFQNQVVTFFRKLFGGK